MAEPALLKIKALFPDKLSRLRGGFYDIKDKDGSKVPFRMNEHQESFITNRHGLDIILKARQLGYTTVIQLDYLDDCLFNDNIAAGIIAHNLNDAKAFFHDKIKFAYDNLPPVFRQFRAAEQDSADSLRFNNGSSIRVGVSLRSGTLQRLHVSEYGKLCAKFPDRAEEVKSGAFNTVHVGQRIVVESTAEGRAGHFFKMTEQARNLERMHEPLTALDFTPWFADKGYSLGEYVNETREFEEYFDKLEAEGIVLTRQQRGWYVKKAIQQDDAMKREYPSTPDEAFEASIEGAYFSRQMAKMRQEGRITPLPIEDKPVYTTWDLGMNDQTAISFWQDVAYQRRLIDYYENSGEGFGHYAKVLGEKGYNYSRHYLPHDAAQRQMGVVAKTKEASANEAGITPTEVVPRIQAEQDGIEASRAFLPTVVIDSTRCQRLIECLDSYRKEWDDRLGVYKDHPRHDEFSHGYKSFETAAVILRSTGDTSRLIKRPAGWAKQFA
jgi:hypothetical protein